MVGITDGVETIVGLLKNSSTGIGTTGYEITDDDSSGLTISNGDILVSYHMGKEDLVEVFGGDQDFDVVFTVKSGEVKDDWIGTSTKQWIQPVIITISVVDKWSDVGSDKKFITATLVRAKAVEALRAFIKANTQNPDGTIDIWTNKNINYEEDATVKPVIYKAVFTTEAQMYYNPDYVECKSGEQVSNGGLEQGDFGGWVNDRWRVSAVYPRTGVYAAEGFVVSTVLKQEFNIKLCCFTVNSIAEFYWVGSSNPCAGSRDSFKLTLCFDNGYEKDITLYATGSWVKTSILSTILTLISDEYVSVNNRLTAVKFTILDLITDSKIVVDDFTIEADGT